MSENIKEIDLLVLLIRFFQFCKKRFLILIIAVVLGGAAGIFVYSLLPENYKYEISGISTEIPVDVVIETLNSSNKFFKHKEDSIFEGFKVPKSLLNKVMGVSASSVEEDSDDLKINLIVNDFISRKDAELLLFSILESNSYVNELLEFKLNQTERIINFLDEQIENYDKIPAKVLKEEGVVIQGDETPTDLFLKMTQYEYRLKYHQSLTIYNFPILPETTKKSLIFYGLVGALLLFILVLCYFSLNKISRMAASMNKQNLSVINYSKSA